MGMESKIRAARRKKLIPEVKKSKVAKPLPKGWKITIWSIIGCVVILLILGVWAYSGRTIEARVGSQAIASDELDARTYEILQQQLPAEQFKPGTEEFEKQFISSREQTLQRLIAEKIYVEAGERADVTITEDALKEEAQKKINEEIKEQLKQTNKDFKVWLKEQGIKDEVELRNIVLQRFQDELKFRIYRNSVLQKDLDAIKVDEIEAKKWYSSTGSMKLSHILLTYDATKDAAELANKKQSDIVAIREDIIKNKKNFSDVAKEKSEDPSAKQNSGDLGWYNIQGENLANDQGQGLVPEFTAVALKLNKGEISEVVRTQFGFHIILCNDVQTNGSKYNIPEGVRMATIRIIAGDPTNTQSAPTEDEMKAAEKQANSIIGEIRSRKINFKDAAAKYSSEQLTKDNGGEMPQMMATDSSGFFWAELSKAIQYEGQGQYPYEKAVVESAWNLKKGQMYDKPVKYERGYVITMQVDKRGGRLTSFDEVKTQVIKDMINQKKTDYETKWMSDRREEYGVSTNNAWKSFATWWENSVAGPINDFGTWFSQLLGKGGPSTTTQTPADTTTPATTDQTMPDLTQEQLQQMLQQQQQQQGQPGQTQPVPVPGNNP